MSGLLALLDDVAAIAKVAATSVDDIAAAAAKAGSKTAGVLIDDAAVTPTYVTGLNASRELPMIWRITKGSFKNKLLYLLPAALLLSNFAPWAITPLLMCGGAYLCFEGAEKIFHAIFPGTSQAVTEDMTPKDPKKLEETRVAGAIKTDFILSAEIMTISLSVIDAPNVYMQAATLALVAIMVTVAVYGVVALIVKMDDVGLHMAANMHFAASRATGRALVRFMPYLLAALSFIGTGAMLWVGGNIITHGLEVLGFPWIYDQIHHVAVAASTATSFAPGLVQWTVTAALDGVLGLALGLALIIIVPKVISPIVTSLTGKTGAH
jgi:predicted DNA repair protein MutK